MEETRKMFGINRGADAGDGGIKRARLFDDEQTKQEIKNIEK